MAGKDDDKAGQAEGAKWGDGGRDAGAGDEGAGKAAPGGAEAAAAVVTPKVIEEVSGVTTRHRTRFFSVKVS